MNEIQKTLQSLINIKTALQGMAPRAGKQKLVGKIQASIRTIYTAKDMPTKNARLILKECEGDYERFKEPKGD